MIFVLTGGDPTKAEAVKRMKYVDAFKWLMLMQFDNYWPEKK